MAIDWKTIISEFDGKPTLLQAIGKLRKAVEEETMTIQQAQAEIAKLESQQKVDEALINTKQDKLNDKSDVTVLYLTATNGINAGTVKAGEVSDDEDNIYNFPKKPGTFALTEDVAAVGTKAQNALDLATTNETDIATLDGQVAQMGQDILNLQNEASLEITLTPATATRGTLTDEQLTTLRLNDNCYIRHNGLIYTLFKRNDENTVWQYTVGYLNDERYIKNIRVIVSSKAWQLDNILLPQAKTYKHHIQIDFSQADSNGVYFDFYSSKNTVCDSLTDLKTVLGNSFIIPAYGSLAIYQDGINTAYFISVLLTESYLKVFYPGDSNFSLHTINLASNPFTLTDTVTTI